MIPVLFDRTKLPKLMKKGLGHHTNFQTYKRIEYMKTHMPLIELVIEIASPFAASTEI